MYWINEPELRKEHRGKNNIIALLWTTNVLLPWLTLAVCPWWFRNESRSISHVRAVSSLAVQTNQVKNMGENSPSSTVRYNDTEMRHSIEYWNYNKVLTRFFLILCVWTWTTILKSLCVLFPKYENFGFCFRSVKIRAIWIVFRLSQNPAIFKYLCKFRNSGLNLYLKYISNRCNKHKIEKNSS